MKRSSLINFHKTSSFKNLKIRPFFHAKFFSRRFFGKKSTILLQCQVSFSTAVTVMVTFFKLKVLIKNIINRALFPVVFSFCQVGTGVSYLLGIYLFKKGVYLFKSSHTNSQVLIERAHNLYSCF